MTEGWELSTRTCEVCPVGTFRGSEPLHYFIWLGWWFLPLSTVVGVETLPNGTRP
jgi:hypothetical protein